MGASAPQPACSRRRLRVLIVVVGLAVVSLSTAACNRFGFTGNIEEIVPATVAGKYGPQVRVSAWVQARTATPWRAYVTLNGTVPSTWGSPDSQSESTTPRPDVERVVGGHAKGFLMVMSPPPRGVYRVCVHAVPHWVPVPQAGEVPGEGDDVVDCGWLIQGRDWAERGDIERLSVSGGIVTVEGWVRYVPAFFKSVGVLIEGQDREPLSLEWGDRPDIDAVYGEGTRSFRFTFSEDLSVARWCIATYYSNNPDPLSVVRELDCVNVPTS